MKTIIAGSRTIHNPVHISSATAACGWDITEVVCGGAAGVDMLGANWAQANNIHIKMFPADWNQHGKKAGYLRNAEMAQYADALILIWDGTSRGSAMMRQLAVDKGMALFEVVLD
jgi:hypothetical protein